MSVLVKGMKMPKGCYECYLLDGEYGGCKAGATGEYDPYRKDCPLEDFNVLSDSISRDDAIALVIKAIHGTDNKEIQEYLFDGLRKQMWSLPSAEAVQGWIPVSERLPSEDGEYLVFYEGPIIGSRIEIMWYGEPLMPNVDVSGKHFYRSDSEWGDIIYDEVIAWAPLQKPYKGGDSE